nr:DUF5050 domain-containing protein [uncultured Acetobacterium sp.]
MKKILMIGLSTLIILLITGGVIFAEEESKETVSAAALKPIVSYQTHIENIGWEAEDAGQAWKLNGEMSGTSGKGLRLEGIKIKINNDTNLGVQYQTHIQNIGWEDDSGSGWKKDAEMSGTKGMGYRLEAIQIKLTGVDANNYDLYYRVHAQNLGWLDWAKNGESAGTAGFSYRLEAIEIILREKGGDAPGITDNPFIEPPPKSYDLGNTAGNLMNGGGCVYKDGNTYVNFLDGNNLYTSISKIDSSGNASIIYTSPKYYNPTYLNIKDDWLYYYLKPVLNSNTYDLSGIYKIRLDGTQNTPINSEFAVRNMSACGDQLFFSNGYRGVLSIGLNGENLTTLSGDSTLYTINDGLLYYQPADKSLQLLNLENNSRSTVQSKAVSKKSMIIENDYIFYLTFDGELYRMNMNGSNLIKLSNDKIGSFNIKDGYIYYGLDQTATIKRMNLDGSQKTVLINLTAYEIGSEYSQKNPFSIGSILLSDKSIYYFVSGGTGAPDGRAPVFRASLTGENNEKINNFE